MRSIFPSAQLQKPSRMQVGNSKRAIENIITLRKHGWRGVDLNLHLDAASQVEKVAVQCLKKGDWVLDHMQEELAFMRGNDFRR